MPATDVNATAAIVSFTIRNNSPALPLRIMLWYSDFGLGRIDDVHLKRGSCLRLFFREETNYETNEA